MHQGLEGIRVHRVDLSRGDMLGLVVRMQIETTYAAILKIFDLFALVFWGYSNAQMSGLEFSVALAEGHLLTTVEVSSLSITS